MNCKHCKSVIEKPRLEKGKIVQGFCSDSCRYSYHNRLRRNIKTVRAVIVRMKADFEILRGLVE